MARIPLDPPRSLLNRLTEWYSRRTYSAVLDPGAAIAHNRRVLLTYVRYETSLARWNRLDPTLKALAVMSSAATIGCSWCMDFGFWESSRHGIDPAKLRDVPRWRDSDVYTDLERAVMAYAEAMTATPPEVTERFFAACAGGDVDALLAVLAPDAVLISDGGGKATAALRPIEGADKVARFVAAIATQGFAIPGLRIEVTEINGSPGIVAWVDGDPLIAMSLDVAGGRIEQVLVVRNPDKLAGLSVAG